VKFAQRLHLGLHLLHLGHRLVALVGQREEDQLHGHGQQQDGDAEVADVAEEEVQQLKIGRVMNQKFPQSTAQSKRGP
jgi:hypothetical protein